MIKAAKIIGAATLLVATASPAFAGTWNRTGTTTTHVHSCTCGHVSCNSTTSGGTNTSGGTSVPEPGMLGMVGVALIGLGLARKRRQRKA